MSGSYEVDPEALPRAIAELKEALDCVLDLQSVSSRLEFNKPTRGDDAISLNAGEEFVKLASSPESGSLALTLMKLRDEILNTIDNFEDMLREYLNLEEGATLPEYEGEVTKFEYSKAYQQLVAGGHLAI
ncbi:hypothetical protein C1701_16705 [Actinoalloteichus sp. AHMU CJ021]|uniref:hypothetical protein n=1 Tax=Actinoalloteichus sp. AHMU CJ021 TaxID=2072503 RepID=UPI000CA03588|nr:hypothetical protein C1701_16705 [Actinoalloteichus sp. AHMU CJ021]